MEEMKQSMGRNKIEQVERERKRGGDVEPYGNKRG
jgi:hypothetical protein